ncbi:unnamed protein product [Ambrosiozyma monospora]|uniref:Unnamed protein product n=1 Tax=Ambrosiozyma monospora TaxID=43982 RepID=A0ACB5UA65_AMBMO|nr:unnamed protein product [Ambrosiozyma monospora]
MEAEFAKLTTASIQYNMNNAATKQTRLENPTHILSRLQDGDTDLQQQQQQLEAGNDSGSLSSRASISSKNSESSTIKKPTFTFLIRVGRKTTTRELKLPENVKFTSNFVKEVTKQQQEKAAIKSLVLNSVENMDTTSSTLQGITTGSLNTVPGPFRGSGYNRRRVESVPLKDDPFAGKSNDGKTTGNTSSNGSADSKDKKVEL